MSLVKLNGSHIKPEVQNPGKSLGEKKRERKRWGWGKDRKGSHRVIRMHFTHIRNSQRAKPIKRKKKIKNTVGLHSGSKIV